MQINYKKKEPDGIRPHDLKKGEVYELIKGGASNSFYMKTDEPFLINLKCGTMVRLSDFAMARFRHCTNAELVV